MNQIKKTLVTLPILFSSFCAAESISIEQLTGHFDEKADLNFIALDETQLPVNKKGMYLQKEVAQQLTQAYQDFKKEHPDVPFVVVSATRNYQYQNGIWTRKWQEKYSKINDAQKTAEDILQFSSMPGTSRHHWGTDFDLTSLDPDYFVSNPKGQILNAWLIENMPKYGFCKPYTKGRNGGYQPEDWHWSYLPISRQYLTQYKEAFEQSPEKLVAQFDFKGANEITLHKLIKEFVFEIDANCQF